MSASAAPTNGGGPRVAIELDCAAAPPTTVLVRGARLLDPRAGLDKLGDVLVRDGRIAELGENLSAPDGAEVVDGEGLHALPAFVDPHVHLRTPGREDEEDIDSGTRAAAADTIWSETFLPVPSAAAAARHFVTATLDVWGLGDLSWEASLVVSELATNAVRPVRSTETCAGPLPPELCWLSSVSVPEAASTAKALTAPVGLSPNLPISLTA